METGGIERFKKGIHGKNIKDAAIIGYVQLYHFDYWFEQINQWIDELILNNSPFWNTGDKLIKHSSGDSTVIYKSKNSRTISKELHDHITLTHFWIDLVK